MGKLANAARTQKVGPFGLSAGVITSEPAPSGQTALGAPGFKRIARSELFLLAVTNFVMEDTFHEAADDRDRRYRVLVEQVTAEDPKWVADMLGWLRTGANMRSASIVGAVYAAHVMNSLKDSPVWKIAAAQGASVRRLVSSVLQRPDEPGEFIAFWHATHGRRMPIGVKRGIGDAIMRLYTERNTLKYDSDRNPFRFADVIELSQVCKGKGDETGLFGYLLDRRHGRNSDAESGLPTFMARDKLTGLPAEQRRAALASPFFPDLLHASGMTWEAVSGWLGGPMDREAWEACIPVMRYGALIKNLNNMDKAGISKAARAKVAATLTDPEQVRKSRLLPQAFLTAYRNVATDFWRSALDEAATHALGALPHFGGKTLVLIDTSGSMGDVFSRHAGQGRRRIGFTPASLVEPLTRWEVASLFGIAMALSSERAEVISYSSPGHYSHWAARPGLRARTLAEGERVGSVQFPLWQTENLLASVARFRRDAFLGGGTDTAGAVARHFTDHDRVVLLTDEQTATGDVFARVPVSVPCYTFNLAGYEYGYAASAHNRYVVGGLSDAGFKMIANIEKVTEASVWPWEMP